MNVVLFAPVLPPPPVQPAPPLPVIKSSQFKTLGYQFCPKDVDPLSAGVPYLHYSGGAIVKRQGGVRTFLLQGTDNKHWQGPGPNNGDSIIEISDAGWGPIPSAPRATIIRAANRSEVYGTFFPPGLVAGQFAFDGKNLYWNFAAEYNVTPANPPSFGQSTINADGIWTPNGAAVVGGGTIQGVKRIFGYLTIDPAGRVIGGAGTQSGDQQCAYSPGANIVNSDHTLTPLCYWPKTAPMPRDAYFTCPGMSSVNGVVPGDPNARIPANTWDALGHVTAGAWIRTATCEGLLLAGNVTAPGAVSWYGPGTIDSTAQPPMADGTTQGAHASSRVPRCWIFSAADLAAVKAGTLSAGAIQPTEFFDPRIVFGFSMIPEHGAISGLAWDGVAGELIVNTGCNGDGSWGGSVLAGVKIT